MEANNTKYIYRDIATGRLLHERQAQQRPADSWVREPFAQPVGLQSPYAHLKLTGRR